MLGNCHVATYITDNLTQRIAASDIGRQFRWLGSKQASHFVVLLGTNRIVFVFLKREVALVHPDAIKHGQTMVRIVDGTDGLAHHLVRYHGFGSAQHILIGIGLAPSLCYRRITVIYHPLGFRIIERQGLEMGLHLPIFLEIPKKILGFISLFRIQQDMNRSFQFGLGEMQFRNGGTRQGFLGCRLVGISIVLDFHPILHFRLKGTDSYPILTHTPKESRPRRAVTAFHAQLGIHILIIGEQVFILASGSQWQGLAQLEDDRAVRYDVAFDHQTFGSQITEVGFELFHTTHQQGAHQHPYHAYNRCKLLHRFQNLMLYVTNGIGAPKMDILYPCIF